MTYRVAVTCNEELGGSSVISLKKSFASVNMDVHNADFRAMMKAIPTEEFEAAYENPMMRQKLFAHAKAAAEELLKDIDCLALSGNNAMIDPKLFNKDREANDKYDFSRTIAELALVHVACQKGMPIIGICGGHQVIAVYGGGSLKAMNVAQLNKQRYMDYDSVTFNVESLLAKILELPNDSNQSVEKNVFGAHAQVVDELANGFISAATASDGVLNEAAESKHGAPIVSTQFHPEITVHGLPEAEFIYQNNQEEQEQTLKLFSFFKEAAKTYHNKKHFIQEIKNNKGAASSTARMAKNDHLNSELKIPASNTIPSNTHVSSSIKPSRMNIGHYIKNKITSIFRAISHLIVHVIGYIMTQKVTDEINKKEAQKIALSYRDIYTAPTQHTNLQIAQNKITIVTDSTEPTAPPATIMTNIKAQFWKENKQEDNQNDEVLSKSNSPPTKN